MNILVEPGTYRCDNMGDLAMLLVAIGRLKEQWPTAEIYTFTSAPDRLRRYAPEIRPLSVRFRQRLLEAHYPNCGLSARLPASALWKWRLHRCAQSAGLSAWGALRNAVRSRVQDKHLDGYFNRHAEECTNQDLRGFLRSFSLVVVSGAGGLCDPFLPHAWSVLELLEIAANAGVPTALFSQGIGPMHDPALYSKARRVLPQMNVIAVRERRTSLPLLLKLGVPDERIKVTGDDAIELAYQHTSQIPGCHLGVNLRVAGYANVSRALAASVLDAVAAFAKARGVEMLPIPISFQAGESDLRTAKGTLELPMVPPPPDDPVSVVSAVGRCRMVISGSYHGAVFALAQGIPTICLTNSQYYNHKFCGLAEMFGVGCDVIDLRAGNGNVQRLQDVLEENWRSGGRRQDLLRSAAAQIAMSRGAYRRLPEIVSSQIQASTEQHRPIPSNSPQEGVSCHLSPSA